MTTRFNLMQKWVNQHFATVDVTLQPVSGDASFRKYFRVLTENFSCIIMDAPPTHESCAEFIQISKCLRHYHLNAPDIIIMDLAQGFLALTDFGNQQYFHMLQGNSVKSLYKDALDALQVMQTRVECKGLPLYDEALLMQEMQLFTDWLLERHLQLHLTAQERTELNNCFVQLATAALAQPQVFVHRDYHSRNLMVVEGHNPGILDFQDAVQGAITYDLVSLLRDCYIAWPPEQVEAWVLDYYADLKKTSDLIEVEAAQFLHWFDWMGAQRHLKASGIFARLWHRDGKNRYLADIPRTLTYLIQETAAYPELAFLHELVKARVLPAFSSLDLF